MLIPSQAWAGLLEAGVRVRPLTSSTVELSDDDGSGAVTAALQRRDAALTLSLLAKLTSPPPPAGHLLLVVGSASDATLAAARAAGVSVLVGDEHGFRGHVMLADKTVTVGGGDVPRSASKRRGRPLWGTFTVARLLLEGGASTQKSLGGYAGLSQPRVSQVLSQLRSEGLATKVDSSASIGWRAADWDSLADWFLDRYPGPGGISTYWFGLDGPRDQAAAAQAVLTEAGSSVSVSGDVAADELAPWRRPARAIVYVSSLPPQVWDRLGRSELVPAGETEATLEVVVPADPGVWVHIKDPLPARLPLANGMQVLWDVQRSPGPDTDQAVKKLRTALRRFAEAEQPR